MRKSRQLRIFIAFNVCLVFWHLFQYSLILDAQRHNQQLSAQYKTLCAHKQELGKTWCALRSPQAILEFAQQQSMRPVRLDQIHTVPG